jgi:hypothetical protein
MATVSDLATEARQDLADDTDTAFGNTMMLDIYNDAQRTFAELTHCMQYVEVITTSTAETGTTKIALSGLTYSYLKVLDVKYNGTNLEWAPAYEARKWPSDSDTVDLGTPAGWTVFGDNIRLDAFVPTGQNIEVWYSYVPDDLAAIGGTIVIATKWHNALKAFMKYRCYKVDKDLAHAMAELQEFQMVAQAAAVLQESNINRGGY